jgi:hypothetical protein
MIGPDESRRSTDRLAVGVKCEDARIGLLEGWWTRDLSDLSTTMVLNERSSIVATVGKQAWCVGG